MPLSTWCKEGPFGGDRVAVSHVPSLPFRKAQTRQELPVPWTVVLASEGSPSGCSCHCSEWWTWWT
jgi:hypothetical protein